MMRRKLVLSRPEREKAQRKTFFTFYFLLFTFYFLLPSCTFLYLPPVLPEPSVEPRLELSGSKGLSYSQDKLELSVFLQTVPAEGWLAVQWYAPNNQEAASDSIWIEPRDAGLSQTFALPQIPSKGEWRVVVSFGDKLLRQFSLEVK
jgi:hypothetical protein